jgi:hypothetical protein
LRLCALSLAITLCQTVVALALARAGSLAAAMEHLSSWDAGWFCRIADFGYEFEPARATEKNYQCNAAFFPGFPLAMRAVKAATGLGALQAAPLTGQLACWAFWTYFLLLLRRWTVPPALAVAGVLAVACYPSAFFLVSGYSESLFLAAVLGMVYWARKRGPAAWGLTATHGIVMTATRSVGLVLVLYPLLQAWLERRRGASPGRRGWLGEYGPRLALAAVASLGALAFSADCYFRFGHWDLYMMVSKSGWGVTPDYWRALDPRLYLPGSPFGADGTFLRGWFNKWFALGLMALAGGLLFAEYRLGTFRNRGWHTRAGLYLSAGLLAYLTFAAKATTELSSMVRLALPAHVLLVLAGVHLLRSHPLPRKALAGFGALGLASLLLQLFLTYRFTHALWVA